MKTTKEIIDGVILRKKEDIFNDVFEDKSILEEVWYSKQEIQEMIKETRIKAKCSYGDEETLLDEFERCLLQ